MNVNWADDEDGDDEYGDDKPADEPKGQPSSDDDDDEYDDEYGDEYGDGPSSDPEEAAYNIEDWMPEDALQDWQELMDSAPDIEDIEDLIEDLKQAIEP